MKASQVRCRMYIGWRVDAGAGIRRRPSPSFFTRICSTILLCLLFATLSWGATPPPNDNFANRITLTGLTVVTNGTNIGATKEAGEPDHGGDPGGKSIWWSWTAPETRNYTFSTLGSVDANGTNLDTIIAVYTGTAFNNLNLIAFSDDPPRPEYDNYNSQSGVIVHLAASAGTTYQIAVDGFAGLSIFPAAEGSIILSILPENDHFTDAISLTNGNLVTIGSSLVASQELNEKGPLDPDDPGGKSVWWRWTAPTNGNVTITTRGSDFDTTLALYTGTSLLDLTLLANNDDDASTGGGLVTSRIDTNVVAGTQYYIQVDGLFNGTEAESGNIMLTIGMNNVPALLTATGISNGKLNFNVQGGLGSSYQVQSSLNLTNWTTNVSSFLLWPNLNLTNWATVTNFPFTKNTLPFAENTNSAKRFFYRVVTP